MMVRMQLRAFPDITYLGPPASAEALARVPLALRTFLSQTNGVVAYRGALHVRGLCAEPEWHSLESCWAGPNALHREYPTLNPDDVPFGQDCVGDQFILRGEPVMRLAAETGEIEVIAPTLDAFWALIRADPVEALGMHPLLQLETEGGTLRPGQLISAYPPFCTKEAADGVSLRAVPALELNRFHADFARQLAALPEGRRFVVKVVD